MFARKGFTLVEILFVLIIAAGIMAFAVPSYKRAKERTKYEAATGILMDVGSAAMQVNRTKTGCARSYYKGYLQVPDNYYVDPDTFMEGKTWAEYLDDYLNHHDDVDQACVDSLFGLGYLQKIPANTGYEYYIVNNPKGLAICSDNCAQTGTVACMCQAAAEQTKGSGCFYGARFLKDGSIERFSLAKCTQ